MSNLQYLISKLIGDDSLRDAGERTGIKYWKLHRLLKSQELTEATINTLETLRRALKLEKSEFWGALTKKKSKL